MKLRTILAPAVLGVLTLAPTTDAFATAPAGGDASTEATFPEATFPAGDDITKVHVVKTTKDYRAVVSFSDLRAQNANRYVIEFVDFGGLSLKQRTAARSAIAHGATPQNLKANLVEFRRSPSGRESSFGYKINDSTFSAADTPTVVRSTCSLPQRAVADYDADTITFVVPRRCWKPTSGSVLTVAAAVHYPRAPGTAPSSRSSRRGSPTTAPSDGPTAARPSRSSPGGCPAAPSGTRSPRSTSSLTSRTFRKAPPCCSVDSLRPLWSPRSP